MRWRLWASAIELEAAAIHLGVKVQMQDGTILNREGLRTGCVVKMKNEHYTVWKGTGKSRSSAEACSEQRGGMQPPPPWRQPREEDLVEQYVGPFIVDVNPREAFAPPRIVIFTDYTVSQEVTRASFIVAQHPDMARIRQTVTGLLGLEPTSVDFQQPGQHVDLPDWIPAPFLMVMHGGERARTFVPMVTLRSPTGQAWRMPFDRSENHLEFLTRVSNVVNVPTRLILTKFQNGQPWIFPMDLAEEDDVAIEILRGGMQSPSPQQHPDEGSHTVSTTLPFAIGAPLVRSRSLTEQNSLGQNLQLSGQEGMNPSTLPEEDAQSEMQSTQDDDMEAEPIYDPGQDVAEGRFWIWRYPSDPPSAQPAMLRRYMHAGPTRLAEVWAPAQTGVGDILDELERRVQPHEPLQVVPHHAKVWLDVLQVQMPEKVVMDGDLMWDLREGKWEPYQMPRIVPLLHKDVITAKFILPRKATQAEVQDRVSAAAENHELWQVHVLGHQWLVVAMPLPQRLKMRLRDLAKVRGGAALECTW